MGQLSFYILKSFSYLSFQLQNIILPFARSHKINTLSLSLLLLVLAQRMPRWLHRHDFMVLACSWVSRGLTETHVYDTEQALLEQ